MRKSKLSYPPRWPLCPRTIPLSLTHTEIQLGIWYLANVLRNCVFISIVEYNTYARGLFGGSAVNIRGISATISARKDAIVRHVSITVTPLFGYASVMTVNYRTTCRNRTARVLRVCIPFQYKLILKCYFKDASACAYAEPETRSVVR